MTERKTSNNEVNWRFLKEQPPAFMESLKRIAIKKEDHSKSKNASTGIPLAKNSCRPSSHGLQH
ncbi:hypothetical protein HMPREF9420_0976 [Segatella salivae DSM 15606]|uniref:Uncharacterized protein n=1 Tax=Segatella salivae DSM 15606 TaxID=888832 RepID=E6MNA8_9BACT|nr:hypothetical protein HMPREF9420_0976 [Segatella salivae DSM 15606]